MQVYSWIRETCSCNLRKVKCESLKSWKKGLILQDLNEHDLRHEGNSIAKVIEEMSKGTLRVTATCGQSTYGICHNSD